jgi:hypothetical protein
MSGIPAGFVSKSDLERIRAAIPGAETEAERIGQLILKGEETEADLLRLVQLLYTAGETPRAELMLVANSRDGDQLHALHRELFRNVEREYEGALTALSDQLCVLLAPVRTSRLYSRVFSCSSASNDNKPIHWIWNHFRTPFEAQVTYEPGMGIVADLYSAFECNECGEPAPGPIPLRYEGGAWARDRYYIDKLVHPDKVDLP